MTPNTAAEEQSSTLPHFQCIESTGEAYRAQALVLIKYCRLYYSLHLEPRNSVQDNELRK
jgi:hypothetical protein